jgi:hypothetical protein
MCVAPTWPRFFETFRDGHADHVHFARHDERCVDADRFGKWRQPDAGGEWTRLMVDVDDLRFPLTPGVFQGARFHHVQHVGVAVVVVAGVFLIQLRQAGELVRRADVLHVPLRDHLLAVGIDTRPEHQHHVVEYRFDVGSPVIGGYERSGTYCGLRLRPTHFASCVGRLAFAGGTFRFGFSQTLGMCQTPWISRCPIDLAKIVGRRDQREYRVPGWSAGYDHPDMLCSNQLS